MVAVSGHPQLWFAAILQFAVVLILPLLWAWEVRNHQEARRQAEIAAQALQELAVRERELTAARTALQVQEHGRRIAQDLHDGVAGHLSAVALQTAALRTDGMREADAQTRDRVLESIRVASVDALAEMRSLIDVLRHDADQHLEPATTWENVTARLKASHPGAQVTDPHDAAALLAAADPQVVQAVLRVAQESVTNVLKHATPGPVHLNLWEDAGLRLSCISTLPADPAQPYTDEAGLGLRSMRLRTEDTGGTLSVGPAPDLLPGTPADGASWRVDAHWPQVKNPAPSTVPDESAIPDVPGPSTGPAPRSQESTQP